MEYQMVVNWDEEGAEYVATVPAIPGISGIAATSEEACAIAQEAITMVLEILAEDGA